MVKRRLTTANAWLPPQRAPVRRPDLIDPYSVIDLVHGDVESLVTARMMLVHGANYNDPPRFQTRTLHQWRRR